MSDCRGCFNGCADIISDQCVKYTGDTISELDITKGDPLSEVEEKITDFLLTVLDGTGILPTIPAEYICTLIDGYLPASPTLNDILSAIIQAACDLQEQVDAVVADVATIEATYTIPSCLTVSGSGGTHLVLQAVLTKLCAMNTIITALQTALSQYVKIIDLDGLIQDYLDSIAATAMYTKMVPYSAVEYYGPLSGYPTVADGFTANGIGFGAWEKVFLCNGLNGTPDKRGRVPVGCNTMSCNPYITPETDPATPGNPNYDLLDVAGENNTILSVAQLPPHSHPNSDPIIIDPGHRHIFGGDRTAIIPMGFERYNDIATGWDLNADTGDYGSIPFYTKSASNQVGQQHQITNITATLADTGNTGLHHSHDNRLPVVACYYIMHIP